MTTFRTLLLLALFAALPAVASGQVPTGTTANDLKTAAVAAGSQVHQHQSEANLRVPSLDVTVGGYSGTMLLKVGLVVCVLGIVFGLFASTKLRNMPVHKAMVEISELIYATCKTYLHTQGKFIMLLWLFVGTVIAFYFRVMQHFEWSRVALILFMSLVGIAGSYGVAWFGIRVNTYANSRTAFAALKGEAYPVYGIPLLAGMSIGMVLISVELLLMLLILLYMPGEYAGACFIGFAIGESLGAAALRIAGGIFTKIADIGSDLMKIVFKIKEDDARNPGVIADCTGDNAGDSVGPSADGFETYGVTGVALITYTLLAFKDPAMQVQILVWLFVMRILMVIASGIAYFGNEWYVKARTKGLKKMNFEHPLTQLVWVTSFLSVGVTFLASKLLLGGISGENIPDGLWWKLSAIISCGTLAGAIIPELIKVFTSTSSGHVRETVDASKEGGASLNVLAGFTSGNFSAYWTGMAIALLMAIALWFSNGFDGMMLAPGIFAFGLVAFGFLGMGPVTIAVDSYGPVTDNAQSVYELSLIETIPNIKQEIKKDFGFDVNFDSAKDLLEENDGAGNTFKATAKPVLIGTAVVGATTMVFAIIMGLTSGLTVNIEKLSILHPPFLLGMMAGGAMIYWFTGAATQAVATGAYRAVEFIKANIKLDGAERASIEDSKKVVAICTQYAQKGMFNIFMGVFFATLAFACMEAYFFIGYLISTSLFGLFQALFLANAGGCWDNAKKVVETELKMKGTPLHDACVVGDTVGDPFKDTSSVAMNPVIKFTTLFGLLAVELAQQMRGDAGMKGMVIPLAIAFFLVSVFFVHRSFYGMRISSSIPK